MKTAIFIAATLALAGGAALSGAAAASADAAAVSDFTGRYAYAYAGGQGGFSTTWSVTPCGDGCVHVKTSSGLTDTDAHLADGRWVFERYDEAGIACDNDKVLPATVRFSVDPGTMKGELQPLGKPCGGTSRMSTFTLTKLA